MNPISLRRPWSTPGNETAQGAATNPPRSLDHYLRSPELNNFNLLRLIAATAVAFGHSFALSLNGAGQTDPVTQLMPYTHCGAVAVEVFFLISGIFVSQSLFYERNAISFAIKRAARILPGLIVCLFVSVILILAVFPDMRSDLLQLPATYTYILNNSVLKMQWTIPGVFEDRKHEAINGSLWTLPLEAKMYGVVLIFGVLGILYSSYMTLLAAIVLALVVLVFPDHVSAVFNARNKEALIPVIFFFAGMAVFAYRKFVRVTVTQLFVVLVLTIIVGLPTSEILFYIFLALATIWFGCSSWIARLPKLSADYSYGIYIYAFPIQQLIVSIWPDVGPYQMFAMALPPIFLLAGLSWHLVELPAQIAGKKMAHAVSGKAAERTFWSGLGQNVAGLVTPVLVVGIAAVGFAVSTQRLNTMGAFPLSAEIQSFGPRRVVHGQPFNQQPNGESALWVKLDRSAGKHLVLVLAGEKLTTKVRENFLSATVPSRLVGNPGPLPLLVEGIRYGRLARTKPVTLEVR